MKPRNIEALNLTRSLKGIGELGRKLRVSEEKLRLEASFFCIRRNHDKLRMDELDLG